MAAAGLLVTSKPTTRSVAPCRKSRLHGHVRRLSTGPEHPFRPHDDCLAATRWILDNLNALAPNNGLAVIAGDSAGGNLTACTIASLPGSHALPAAS